MTYTIDDYKKVCYAAAELSRTVERLKEVQYEISNYGNWLNFGKCLEEVYAACDEYNRVNNQCAIDAYIRGKNNNDQIHNN